MACWARPSNTAAKTLMSISTSGGSSRFQIVYGANSLQINATAINSAGSGSFAGIGTIASGAWQHYAAVFSSSTSRVAYLDGVASITDTNSVTVSGVNRTILGSRISSGVYGGFWFGDFSESAIWNVALSASEIAWLAQGARPDSIRPQNLVFYNPLDDRWTYDRARGLFLTDVGPTGAAEDPPFLQKPRRKYFLFGDTAAPASVIFRNRTGSRSRLIA